MAKIVLENVSKRFGSTSAVKSVSLTVEDGELMVFVGPSGCGKSTTLRMIAGLETVSDGSIHIGERDVTWLQPKDRNVAMVFQNYALYAHKNVAENLAFGLKMRRTPKHEIDERVRRAAEILGIEGLLDRKPKQLSGGQMQRVALGRAIVRDPDAFLLDEPLSNLDAKLRVRMREEIAKLHAQTKSSMVYVTHDQVEAMTLGDRIVVMKDGEVQQIGRPLELYDRPSNLFVAGFIGSPEMNLINGAVGADSGAAVFSCGGFRLGLPNDGRFAAPRNGKAVLGVRPDHLYIDADGPIRCGVVLSEQLGSQTLVIADADGVSLSALTPRNDQLRPGDRINLGVRGDDIHLFDGDGGGTLLAGCC